MIRAVLVGAGGLGGPVAYALVAAGMGALELHVWDDDIVDLSNLQRQIQFTTADIGRAKVDALADELARRGAIGRGVRVVGHRARVTAASATAAIAGATVVIDGSDNFATKFAVNDACAAAGVPFAIGGVLRYTGQVLGVAPGVTGCYRCVFEAPPDGDDDADSCAGAGVLGAAVGVVAAELARTALGLAAGDPDAAELVVFEDLAIAAPPRRLRVRRRTGCSVCRPGFASHPSQPAEVV